MITPQRMPARPHPTVSVNVIRAIFAEAIARGLDPAELLARFDLTAAQIADVDARVEAPLMIRIWKEVAELLGDKHFGLHVAERADVGATLSLAWYLIQSAPTLGDGLQRILRYDRLVQDGSNATFTIEGNEARLVYRDVDPTLGVPRHGMEFAFGSFALLSRRTTGKQIYANQVSFRHSAPSSTAEHQRIFGCPVRFGAEANEVLLDVAMLALPQLTADPVLADVLERQAALRVAAVPGRGEFTARVRRVVSDELRRGECDLKLVAEKLKVNPRTAQRRLKDEGTNLQRVMDEVRRERAFAYLDDPSLGIQEVAFLLGFSDQSAFHHAFVRWTGAAPGQYRKRPRA